MTEPKDAPVERRHRLAVLQAQGYSEAWLAERSSHLASHWLEQGTLTPNVDATNGQSDKLAQAMANMEALGRGEEAIYQEAVRRVVDRVERALDQEFGVERKQLQPLPFSKGLVGAINDVFSFHDATETPCLDAPQWPGNERAQLRWDMAVEELGELGDALGCNHDRVREAVQQLQALRVEPFATDLGSKAQLIDVADALVDKIYIDVGTLLEFGLPGDRVWNEVQRANMAKVGPDGVKKRADGKVLKPEGWTPPDVEKAVFGPRFETVTPLDPVTRLTYEGGTPAFDTSGLLRGRDPAHEPPHDACEKCHGARGGVPGNEQIVDGVTLCDYCHADTLPKHQP